jgi:hypothetical protein
VQERQQKAKEVCDAQLAYNKEYTSNHNLAPAEVLRFSYPWTPKEVGDKMYNAMSARFKPSTTGG